MDKKDVLDTQTGYQPQSTRLTQDQAAPTPQMQEAPKPVQRVSIPAVQKPHTASEPALPPAGKR